MNWENKIKPVLVRRQNALKKGVKINQPTREKIRKGSVKKEQGS
jgi:hypothetical protein